jgi:hypothetical protein
MRKGNFASEFPETLTQPTLRSEKLRWAEMQKREGWTEEFYLENEVVM